ncbi:MAG: rane protein [Solirubrobacteraceae bacterium]|nr:rane protein [Solirubrobacteraceae bacterium]
MAAVQETGQRLSERARRERQDHPSIDAVFEMADRDAEVGGGIMAGALAYRLFIWLLPAALVAIAGLGYAAAAASVDPKDAAQSLGLAGIVSSSVAGSAQSSSRAYALLVGLPILLVATRSFLRTLIIAHRLVWTDARTAATKPTVVATVRLLVAIVGFAVISTLTATLRHASVVGGTIALLVLVIPYSALWLLVSVHLPHRDAPWQNLVPGALVLGIGLEAMQAATTYFIGPSAESKQGTYGSLGVAAALLLGLFFISRILVATAVVNATLWDRRARRREGRRIRRLKAPAPGVGQRQ